MKCKRAAFFALLAAVLICPCLALGASAVPERVLDARDGLVRVVCETDGTVSCGTGFAIGQGTPVKYIVTNHHVVAQQGAAITVLCANALSVDASIYIENENADLCILKLQTPLYDLQPLTIDDTDAADAGDAVYALGFPATTDTVSDNADTGNVTVTDGIISALESGKLTEDGVEVTLMQTDAFLSGGSTGGPLLNENGYVVGVNTLWKQDAGIAVSAQILTGLLDAGGISYRSASDANTEDTWGVVLMAAAGTMVLAAIIIYIMKRRRRAKMPRMAFNDFFADPARPMADKLSTILPVVAQVQKLHRQSCYHLDICPENLTLTRGGASLRVKSVTMGSGGMIAARPGYCAPERFSGNVQPGPWSDVYALSALLYTVMTGRIIAPAFERRHEDILFEGIADEYAPLTKLISQGLSTQPSQRPLLDALSVQIQTCLIGHSPTPFSTNATAGVPVRNASVFKISEDTGKPEKAPVKKKGGKKRTAVLCAAALVLLLGAALLVTEINYAQAVMHVEAGEYSEAEKSLKGVFSFYKDTQQLTVFTQAALKLENGEYDAASRLFTSLGDFRSAPDMVLETAYQHAQFNMENGRYTQARELLDSLGDYKDAQQMRDEIAYQNACTYMDAAMYLSALEELKTIGSYKDAAALTKQVTAALHGAAVNALAAGDTQTADSYFEAIEGYE